MRHYNGRQGRHPGHHGKARIMRYVVTIITGNRETLAAFGATAAAVASMPTPPAPAMLRARPIG